MTWLASGQLSGQPNLWLGHLRGGKFKEKIGYRFQSLWMFNWRIERSVDLKFLIKTFLFLT